MGAVNLRAQVGDSFSAGFRYLRLVDGVFKAVDLSAATYQSAIRLGPHKRSALAPAVFGVSTLNAADGTLAAALPANHLLTAGVYFYEIDVIIGSEKDTVASGTLTVEETLI